MNFVSLVFDVDEIVDETPDRLMFIGSRDWSKPCIILGARRATAICVSFGTASTGSDVPMGHTKCLGEEYRPATCHGVE